ncbi:uncharacterized protein TNIN_228231 [Trichonephila inaurata madagascariensis]|uniref:Uncharacterized protein n=1 Tax=Trichonephila inaurata madagascariensis TaxID=2747483 RepID=A0A8X6Y9B8_9ARAC|nr:uncharacterized protein TNIN_228231 [Trichonephila inaurata madagascariensis]
MSVDPIRKRHPHTQELPLSITIKESSPMNMLTKAMTNDVDLNKARLYDTVKLILERAACTATTVAMPWKIKSYFPDTFITITEVELNVRCFYAKKDASIDMVRVGGRVLKLKAFPESNLKQTKECLGDLNLLAQVEPNQYQYFVPPEFNGSTEKHTLEEDDAEESVVDCIPSKHKKTWDT